jgi:hypothetical protein
LPAYGVHLRVDASCMSDARKHRRTGPRPPRRSSRWRPSPHGLHQRLEYGEVRAIKPAKLHLPPGVDPGAAEIAGRALERIVDVMEERVSHLQSASVLSSATRICHTFAADVLSCLCGGRRGSLFVNQKTGNLDRVDKCSAATHPLRALLIDLFKIEKQRSQASIEGG